MYAPRHLTTLVVMLLLTACGAPGRSGRVDTAFFPQPPDLPRIQFLRSLNGSVDFVQRKSTLASFIAGKEPGSDYVIEKPFGVAASKDHIYVTDSFGAQACATFEMAARSFYLLGKTRGPGVLRKPISVFADAAGNKVIGDVLRQQVVVFGPDDTFLRSYGRDEFVPVAAVATEDRIYVLDMAKDPDPKIEHLEHRRDQLVVIDRQSGDLLSRIGQHGRGQDGFLFATHLALDREGNIYIADSGNYRVLKVDRDGNVLAEFGRQGDRAGDFDKIKGLAVDRDGLIYVVDAALQTVQVFDNSGAPLFVFGGHTAPAGALDLPAGVWIDYDNIEFFREYIADDFEVEYLVYVTNQLSATHRVNVYAYGKRRGHEYPGEVDLQLLGEPQEVKWKLPVHPPNYTPLPEVGAASDDNG